MKQISVGHNLFTYVDDEDFEKLSIKKWCLQRRNKNNPYAITKPGTWRERNVTIYMHRVIMDAPKGVFIDHIDGNGLNNQRSNLRFATRSQNSQNMRLRKTSVSGYKGVCWNKKDKVWISRISVEGKPIHLGSFKEKEAAAAAYNIAALMYFGEFAFLNQV